MILSSQVSSDTQPRAQIEGHQASHAFLIDASQTQTPPDGHSQPPSQPFCFRLRREQSQWILPASWSPGSLTQCCISGVTCSRHLLLLSRYGSLAGAKVPSETLPLAVLPKRGVTSCPSLVAGNFSQRALADVLFTYLTRSPTQPWKSLSRTLRPSADFRLVKECSQHM